jgi:hypothetical protein
MYSARQNLMVRAFLAIAQKVGAWSKNHDAEGACYTDEALNSAKAAGLMCRNCAFWKPQGACAIVKGSVQAGGICRLHVIPAERLGARKESVSAAPRGRMVGEVFR